MKIICGIDEAGRGPLAGPVTAAAVILNEYFPREILNDSKKLSEKKRIIIYNEILSNASAFGVGWVWHDEIDQINIHNASLLAMQRAYENMKSEANLILVDGKFTPKIENSKDFEIEAIIKGDTLIPEIMAASIIAKTCRDLWMIKYSKLETEYKFEKHKGYPTKEHRELCKEHGLSFIHRKSFRISLP